MVDGTIKCDYTIVAGGTAVGVYVYVIEGDAGKGVEDVRAVTR